MRLVIALTMAAACAWLMPGCGGRARRSGGDSDAGNMSASRGGSAARDEDAAGSPLGGSPSVGGTLTSEGPETGGMVGSESGAPNSAGQDSANGYDQAMCDGFLALWRVRQSERAEGEPIPPPGVGAPCFDCIGFGGSECESLATVGCSGAEACLERHCLCTREAPVQATCNAEDYPTDLCACTETCIPTNDSCARPWIAYMQCVVSRCSEACGR